MTSDGRKRSTREVMLGLSSGWFPSTHFPEPERTGELLWAAQRAADSVVAQDSFSRSVATAWRSAATGGAWTLEGSAAAWGVDGSRGPAYHG